MATRLFQGRSAPDYAVPEERIGDKVEIVRLASASPDYLRQGGAARARCASFAEALIAWIARAGRAARTSSTRITPTPAAVAALRGGRGSASPSSSPPIRSAA